MVLLGEAKNAQLPENRSRNELRPSSGDLLLLRGGKQNDVIGSRKKAGITELCHTRGGG